MFYKAFTFEQNLNIWLKWVTKGSHSEWCGGGAVCNLGLTFAPTKLPSAIPSIAPSHLDTAFPSTESKFTARDKLITQVKIYCRDSVNYKSQYGCVKYYALSIILGISLFSPILTIISPHLYLKPSKKTH